jgi:hypothetical protein
VSVVRERARLSAGDGEPLPMGRFVVEPQPWTGAEAEPPPDEPGEPDEPDAAGPDPQAEEPGSGQPRARQAPAPYTAEPERPPSVLDRRQFGAVFATMIGLLTVIIGLGIVVTMVPKIEASVASPVDPANEAWVAFQGPGFSAQLPNLPAEAASPAPMPGIPTPATRWQAGNRNALYAIERVSFAGASVDPAATLSTAVTQVAQLASLTIRSTGHLTIGPYLTEDAVASAGKRVADIRAMATGTGLWILSGETPNGPPTAWQRFLLSFDPTD